jgi:hypothetical protein
MNHRQVDISIRDYKADEFVKKHGKHLCHYTSVKALLSILDTKEFWLGSTATMNDKSEIKHFAQKFKEISNHNGNKRYCSFCDQIDTRIKDENNYPYAMAFSKLEDDVSLWERYADHAKGVCLIFDARKLFELLYFYGNGMLILNKVFYGFDIGNHELFNIAKQYIEKGESVLKPDFKNEEGLLDNICISAIVHKHNSFSSEKETRLATMFRKLSTLTHTKEEFEKNNHGIRKVLKISMEGLCKDEDITFEELFNKIIIGPHSEQNVYELKEYVISLKYKNLADKIIESKCPLR